MFSLLLQVLFFVNLPEHNALQDGGERGDPDAGCNQDSMLSPEEVTGWSPVGSVDKDLETFFCKLYKCKIACHFKFFCFEYVDEETFW